MNDRQQQQPARRWPDEWVLDHREPLAVATSLLLAHETRWVHRRVETITFVDGSRMQRHMSIDFTIPEAAAPCGRGDAFIIPLALPVKRVFRNLNVRDEGNRSLPMLTRDENAEVGAALLTLEAIETLAEAGEDAPDLQVMRELRDLAGARRTNAEDPTDLDRAQRVQWVLDRFKRAAAHPLQTPARRQRRILWADPTMRGRILELADRFILFVQIESTMGDRRVLKLSYETAIVADPHAELERDRASRPGFVRRTWVSFKEGSGLRPFDVGFAARALFGAESYHVEVEPPEEVIIHQAELGRLTMSADQLGRGRPTREVLRTEGSVHRAHLYASGASRVPAVLPMSIGGATIEVGYVALKLALRPGVVMAPMLISLLTTVILVSGVVGHAVGVDADPEAVSVVLVAAPAAFALYLIPGEHQLVRRMFKILRFIVAVSAVVAFAAAAVFAIDLTGSATAAWWGCFSLISALATIVMGVALWRSYRSAQFRPSDPL